MKINTIRSHTDSLNYEDRTAFKVQIHIRFENGEQNLWRRYGGADLEDVFGSVNDEELLALTSDEGEEYIFETPDEAQDFILKAQKAIQPTKAYWARCEAFPGRDDG